jgi:hypothetical protein
VNGLHGHVVFDERVHHRTLFGWQIQRRRPSREQIGIAEPTARDDDLPRSKRRLILRIDVIDDFALVEHRLVADAGRVESLHLELRAVRASMRPPDGADTLGQLADLSIVGGW